VAFPLNLVNQAKQATYDVPYAALTRTHDGSVANWEASGQKWVNLQSNGTDEDYGVALLSGNKYGFDLANDGPGEGWSDGKANILRMTLLKSSSQPLPGALGLPFGGPVTDRGSFESSYSLYPHTGPWEEAGVVHQGYEFNYPFTISRTDRHAGNLPTTLSFLEISPSTIVAAVLKGPERPKKDNELILRLFETARKDTSVTIVFPTRKILGAREVDLLERDLKEARPLSLTSNGLSLEVGHDEIVTIRLEYQENAEPSVQPTTAASEGDHCGCSSLGPATHENLRTVYGILFWILIVLIPLWIKKRVQIRLSDQVHRMKY
jgi:alpha-mannosidase